MTDRRSLGAQDEIDRARRAKRRVLAGLILSPFYFTLPLTDRSALVKRLIGCAAAK